MNIIDETEIKEINSNNQKCNEGNKWVHESKNDKPGGDIAKAEEKYNENFILSVNNSNIYQYFKLKEEIIYLDMENLKNTQVYEEDYFNNINIEPDGICLYHCISFHLFGAQEFDENIRLDIYNYININKTLIYEYCYLENNNFNIP